MWNLLSDMWQVLHLSQFVISSANSGSQHTLSPDTLYTGDEVQPRDSQGTVIFISASTVTCLIVLIWSVIGSSS